MAVEKIILDIQAQTAKARKDINNLKTSTKGLNTEVDKTTSLMKKAGASMLAFASIGLITKAIKDMIALNVEFEKTLTNVLTLLNETSRIKFGEFLSTGAITTMRKYGLEVADVNKALFDTISAGIKAGNSIKFLDTASKLAVGGVTDLSTAVEGMTSIMNAYSLSIEDANKVATAFFSAQKFGTTTVQELAQNIGQVAPIARTAGISFQELLAAMALLTQKGLSTDIATTALRATITSLINTTTESEIAFKSMGIETGITAIRSNGLGKTLGQVAGAIEKNANLLTQFIPNVRALNAVSALATEEGLLKYDDILKFIMNDTGEVNSLTEALVLQMQTVEKQADMTTSAWKEFRIELGEQVKETGPIQKFKFFMLGVRGALVSMSEGMRGVTIDSSDMGDRFKMIQPGIAGFAWEIKESATAVDDLSDNLKDLKDPFDALIENLRAVSEGQAGLLADDAIEYANTLDIIYAGLDDKAEHSKKIDDEILQSLTSTLNQGVTNVQNAANTEMEIDRIKAQQKMDIASGAFGFAKGLAGESFALQKVLAIAESIVQTYLGAAAAFTWTTLVAGPIAGGIARRVAITRGWVNTAVIAGTALAGFEEGGFTGKSKYQARDKDGRIAGFVHEDEFVFNKDKTRTLRPLFEDIHNNRIDIHGLAALTRRGTMKTIPKLNADLLEQQVEKIYRKMSEDRPEKPTIIYKDNGYTKQIANTTINVST